MTKIIVFSKVKKTYYKRVAVIFRSPSPDTSEVDSNTDQVERRRSVRVKRDKVMIRIIILRKIL